LFLFRLIYRIYRAAIIRVRSFISGIFAPLFMNVAGAKIAKGCVANGFPLVSVSSKNASFIIGENFRMNSGKYFNQIGRYQPSTFIVGTGARLTIGNNVGISSAAIICHKEIIIGNNVRIGGNTVIYDSDFHSLDFHKRTARPEDFSDVKKKKVEISDNVFIGAHVTILKGVNIGKNSVIGACSVVVTDIPENELWAGNPAKFVRALN